MNLSLTKYIAGVQSGELSPHDVIAQYQKKAHADTHNAWVHFHDDYVQEHIDLFSTRALAAAPIGIKDIILTKGQTTTCASAMLQGYVPPYSATCFEKLEQAGGLMLGKTNMDEFAMGASTEQSYFGPAQNPLDPTRVPGGSSGGSAVAVAEDTVMAALGTDTGGSIRQPAAFCGIVGIKPTYGRVSRYGVQSMASSLDQVGVFTKNVADAALLLGHISGHDVRDAVTHKQADDIASWEQALQTQDCTQLRMALPQQFIQDGIDPRIKERVLQCVEQLREKGAHIDIVDLPLLKYTVPIYYVLVPAEVSTNLARFDGLRFGLQDDTTSYDNIYAYYEKIRHDGLGDEVKRRSMIGAYVLSAGFFDAYYHQAQKVRALLKKEVDKVFSQYDVLIGPTTPSLPWKIGEKVDDPVQMYLADVYTSVANLLGLPAMSLPVGTIQEEGIELPVGFQVFAQGWQEHNIFATAQVLESIYA